MKIDFFTCIKSNFRSFELKSPRHLVLVNFRTLVGYFFNLAVIDMERSTFE